MNLKLKICMMITIMVQKHQFQTLEKKNHNAYKFQEEAGHVVRIVNNYYQI